MSAAWLAIAFVLGLTAGAFLTGLLVLLAGLRATRKRQEHLEQLIKAGRR